MSTFIPLRHIAFPPTNTISNSSIMNQRLDQSEVRVRIRRLIQETTASKRQQEFADLVDMQGSILSKILSGQESISIGQLIKIEKATRARLIWLMYGVEPVYYTGEVPERPEKAHYEGVQLRNYLARNQIPMTELARKLNKTKNTIQGYFKSETLSNTNRVSILKALHVDEEEVFGQIDDTFSLHSSNNKGIKSPNMDKTYNTYTDKLVRLRYVSVKDRQNFLYDQFWSDTIPIDTFPVMITQLKADYIESKTIVFEIEGTNMEPTLFAGDKVTAYEIPQDKWTQITGPVAVSYRDEITIRRIIHNDLLLQGHLMLSSDNPTGGSFPILKSEINHIWQLDERVGGKIR